MTLDFYSRGCRSLKEKRKIVLSVKERLRHRFNISIIESDHQNLWQKIQLTVVMAACDQIRCEKIFNQIEDLIFRQYDIEPFQVQKEFI